MARLLQKELGEIIRQESNTWFRNAMITVTQVRMSPDLGNARVYVSIFAPKGDKEQLYTKLQEVTPAIRGKLGDNIKKQVRAIPALHFFIDDSFDYFENIEKLLGE